jgi:hypothetical protein
MNKNLRNASLIVIVFLITLTSFSITPAKAEVIWDEVEIDVKPNRGRNRAPTINPYSRGKIKVAITSKSFDASTVDPETVVFAGAVAEKWKFKDINKDGVKDLVLRFKTSECEDLPTTSGEHEVKLVGWSYEIEHLRGYSQIRIVPNGRGGHRPAIV